MEASLALPVSRETNDLLRTGPKTFLESNNAAVHPVAVIQNNHENNQIEIQRNSLSNLFGTHLPLRLQMEQQILTQFQRLPGLHSEFVGLETLMGDDEDIQFEDFLNDPHLSERSVNVHAAMEKKNIWWTYITRYL